LRFNLEISFGIENIIDEVKDSMSVSFEEAKAMVSNIDILKLESKETISDEKEKQILAIFENKLKEPIKELNGAIKFQEGKTPGKTIKKIFLSGGGSKIINIDKFLQIKFNKEVSIK
jgi:Tfp pilus assembly PilM family ATPase